MQASFDDAFPDIPLPNLGSAGLIHFVTLQLSNFLTPFSSALQISNAKSGINLIVGIIGFHQRFPINSVLLAERAPAWHPLLRDAGIAQLVEHLICNQAVVGSNPTAGSINFS